MSLEKHIKIIFENIKIENNIHKLNLNDPQQIVDYIINFLSLNK